MLFITMRVHMLSLGVYPASKIMTLISHFNDVIFLPINDFYLRNLRIYLVPFTNYVINIR